MLPVLAVRFAGRAAAAAWFKVSHPGGKINPPTQRPPRSVGEKTRRKSKECIQAELDLYSSFLFSHLV